MTTGADNLYTALTDEAMPEVAKTAFVVIACGPVAGGIAMPGFETGTGKRI